MKCKNSLIFWDPCLSPHKADFLASLARILSEWNILLIAAEGVPTARIKLGWPTPVPVGYRVIVSPTLNEVKEELSGLRLQGDVVHVLSGIKNLPCDSKIINFIRESSEKVFLMSEPRVFEGLYGLARYLHSWFFEGWLRRRVAAVLAIGVNGPPWFRMVGYSAKKIFPFGYFVDRSLVENINSDSAYKISNNKKIKIAYVGRLVKEKGVFVLADAALNLSDNYEFYFVGTGENIALQKKLQSIEGRTFFPGVIGYDLIPNFLSQIDILVLPSLTKDDGWGVVVSEAIFAGVTVIVSKNVGASMVVYSSRGSVINNLDPDELAECIRINSFKCDDILRQSRNYWASQFLSARAGAAYFSEILKYTIDEAAEPKWLI